MDHQKYTLVPQLSPISSTLSESNATLVDRFPSSELKQCDPKAYVQRPQFIYIPLLSFFLLIPIFPSIFFGFMDNDGIAAPPFIANLASSDPRLTSQIATIVSSFMTSSVKWAMAGVVIICAQKHFQHSRPLYGIEVFEALKNGGLAWTWSKRPAWMFWTWVVIVLCGLLTSGFVGLITPFPVAVTKVIAPVNQSKLVELDLSSGHPSCNQWHNETLQATYPIEDGYERCKDAERYLDSELLYTTCPLQGQYMQVLNAAIASMGSRFAPKLPITRVFSLVTSLSQLANTRIIGTTAGTLPIGPAGVNVFSESIFPSLSPPYNYTLNLQGIWTKASCSYVSSAESRLLAIQNKTDGWFTYRLQCPSEDDQAWQAKEDHGTVESNGMIIVGLCFNFKTNNFTFDLRSFFGTLGGSYIDPSSASPEDNVYAGIDAMQCSLVPQVGAAVATYQTSVAAFNITPSWIGTPFGKMGTLAQEVVTTAMWQTLSTIDSGQTLGNGNMFGAAVISTAITYGKLTGTEKNPIVLDLVADALKGVFEYQVTHQRLVLTASNISNAPQPCLTTLNGSATEEFMGWDVKWSTVVGLIPLFIITSACIGVTIWTMLRKDKLTVFDPTNPISLLAAASDGRLRFPDDKDVYLVGDPENEIVRSTRARYGYHDGRWGLQAEKGSDW